MTKQRNFYTREFKLAILAAIIFAFLTLKSQHKIEETESEIEAKALKDEIEKKRKYEEEYGLKYNENEVKEPISDVPLDFHEAHAHDHDEHHYSYKDLYGQQEPSIGEE